MGLDRIRQIVLDGTKINGISQQSEDVSLQLSEFKALVVSDNIAFQGRVETLFSTAGFSTIFAQSSFEAFIRLRNKEAFDLIVVSLEMPLMSGPECYNAIKNNIGDQDFPTFACIYHKTQAKSPQLAQFKIKVCIDRIDQLPKLALPHMLSKRMRIEQDEESVSYQSKTIQNSSIGNSSFKFSSIKS